jgi:phospholipase/carboxylesterase
LNYAHRFIPATSAGPPTILALHGTGGDENDLIPVARMIAPGAAVLSPRGNVLEHGMPRFFRRFAEGIFDLEDLRLRTRELANFIAEAATHYRFDPTRIAALGYSNGANIAASVMLSQPRALNGGVLLRPMVPFEPDELPNLQDASVLISAGRQDPIVPQSQTQRLADLLAQAGADVTLSWFDTGHELISKEIEAASQWFSGRFAAERHP